MVLRQISKPLCRQIQTHIKILGQDYQKDSLTNVTDSIISKLDRQLHRQPNHPVHILKSKIEQYLLKQYPYKILDSMNPIVTTKQNFDDLLIEKTHPGRSQTDTYYVNSELLLRTHTSAHQSDALKSKDKGYLLSADVYRRDEIDPTHYPVFHQMEGIRLFDRADVDELKKKYENTTHEIEELKNQGSNPVQDSHSIQDSRLCAIHLRLELEGLMRELFASDIQIRWIEAYFPFTSPSWEMEIFYNNQWLEVLGCGVMQQQILDSANQSDKIGWAFGIGLERIAMVLFDIQDIRLFWSQDERFLKQFKNDKITKFQPFSKYPSCYKDISFWCGSKFHENDFFEIVRSVCGDLAEQAKLELFKNSSHIPQFHFPYGNPETERNSLDQEWDEKVRAIFKYQNESGRSLGEREFVQVTLACGVNRYLNAALFRKSSLGSDKVIYQNFKKYWDSIQQKYFTNESIAFAILKQGDNNYLTKEDLLVTVNDVTFNHPGLEFLASMPVFQSRYAETVVARLFYSKRQNSNSKMSLAEFKKSQVLDCLKNLERLEDVNAVCSINKTQDVFSYQHFYVIYCKFWELDRDHDMMINLPCLLRYDHGSMTPAILKRVIQGCGKPLQKGSSAGVMTYEDFIWFILSAEDKRTPQAIEYWFRCLDLDGDGIISLYELSHFFEDQYERMLCSRISDVWKFDDFICSLMDLVKPKVPHQIHLQDLKNCRSSYLFFDMIFDLRKYDSYVRRIDPMFRELDDLYSDNPDGTRTKLEYFIVTRGFQKFAAKAYVLLAEEENQSNSNDMSDDYDFQIGNDSSLQMDWDSEEQNWDEEDELVRAT